MPLIDRLGMARGTMHAVVDGVREDACGRSWLLRTMNTGATAPKDEAG
jgi:hypothetical protein